MPTDSPSSAGQPPTSDAQPGDVLEARGMRGAPSRRGVILEVLGEGIHRHYLVRWDEEHESLFYPSGQDDFHITPQ